MPFTYAPDFVIKQRRRRTRQAVDPCLGFYQEIPSSPASLLVDSIPTAVPPRFAGSPFPGAAHIVDFQSELPPPNSRGPGCAPPAPKAYNRAGQDSLTVEEFLRRAITPTKRYSCHRTRRRAAVAAGLGNEPQAVTTGKRRKREIVWTSDDEDYSPEKLVRKRRRRQKKPRPLSARLLTAAVLTGVDMVENLLPELGKAQAPASRPLAFTADNRAPSPVGVKTGRRHFTDPRKAMPFSRAVFQFGRLSEGDQVPTSSRLKKEPQPVTAWRPVTDDVRLPPHGQSKKSHPVATERLITVPLALVPAVDCRSADQVLVKSAETSRKRLASRHREGRAQGDPKALLLESHPKLQAPHSALRLVHDSSFFVPSSSTPTSPIRNTLTSPLADFARLERAADNSQAPSSHAFEKEFLSPTDPPLTRLHNTHNGCAQEPHGSPTPNPLSSTLYADGLSAAPRGPRNTSTVPASELPTSLARSASRKPLKSLVLLLDGFREIARSATRRSLATERQRAYRPRPRGASVNPLAPSPEYEGAACSSSTVTRPVTMALDMPAFSGDASLRRRPLRAKCPDADTPSSDTKCSGGDNIVPHSINRAKRTGPPSSAQGTSETPVNQKLNILSMPQSRQENIVFLPSSPLPCWSALPSLTCDDG